MTGLVYIGLSVFCSVAIAHLLKKVRQSEPRLLNVLVVNYITAAVISIILLDHPVSALTSAGDWVILISFGLGAIFITNFALYSISLHRIGMGISIAAMRLSLIIPIGLSLFIYGERITSAQYLGIGLVFVAFYLMLPKRSTGSIRNSGDILYPILLLLMSGIADASLKVYETEFSSALHGYGFLGLIFLSAFLLGMVALIWKRQFSFTFSEILYGIFIGIANLYSSFFLISALKELPGSVVFPVVNISIVLIGSVIGYLYWKDKISPKQLTGLILALISILLLIGF